MEKGILVQASGKLSKAAKAEAANGAKSKGNKKAKEGPSFGLGKGTVLIRSFIDSTASQWASSSDNGSALPNGSSSEGVSQVLQLAQQLQGSGEEDAGQGSVPETLGQAPGALDRRSAVHLQQALKVPAVP